MKISEALSNIKTTNPSAFSDSTIIKWLSDFDEKVFNELILPREGEKVTHFDGYTENTDRETELLIPRRHDEIYIMLLNYKINLYNQDYEKYNNTVLAFEEMYQDYAAEYARNHRSKETISWRR